MLTINQIKKELARIQSLHRQLNSFYFGDPSEVSSGAAKRYPLMGAFLQPGSVSRQIDTTKLLLYFADRIEDQDEVLQTEIISDMKTVALGVFAQFKNYLETNDIELSREAPLQWFNDADWDDKCFGWQIEITINQFFSLDTCQEPSDYDPEVDESGSVRIYNIETGATVDTVNPGQDYGVLVFSGIHGGTPSTVYTNQIIGNP